MVLIQTISGLSKRCSRISTDGRCHCGSSEKQGRAAHDLLSLPMGMGTCFMYPMSAIMTNMDFRPKFGFGVNSLDKAGGYAGFLFLSRAFPLMNPF